MLTNKVLKLPKREPTKYNLAWLPHEIAKAKQLAEIMGWFDVRDAIDLGEKWGLRIIEVCQLKVGDIKIVLGWGGPDIKGKGGQIRFIPTETDEQMKLLKRLHREAKAKKLMDGDFVISKTIKYGLCHTYTQERDKRLQGGLKRRSKLREGLGHHRLVVTNIYTE